MTALDIMIRVLQANIVLCMVLGIWFFVDELRHGNKEKDENDNDPEKF